MEMIVKGLKIDPAIFTFQYGCLCNGQCCNYGVYTDMEEYKSLMSMSEKIQQHLDDSQPQDTALWFEKPEEDSDFPSGYAVGTELHNGKCVFLDNQGLCTLQKMAIAEGEYKWKYKPLYCILFPLTIYEGELTIDYEHIDRLSHCNKHACEKAAIYEYCKSEIHHLFGEDGYRELEQLKEAYLAQKDKENGSN